MDSRRHTFHKHERLRLRKEVDELFSAGSKSFSAFPVRAVCRTVPFKGVEACILMSVPKRRLHCAVDRNRVKRLLREAYRMNKDIITHAVAEYNSTCEPERRLSLNIALVWMAGTMCPLPALEKKVRSVLHRAAEKYFRPQG